MKKSLFPINIWAYRENSLRLFTFCRSLSEALDYAKQLPFTPMVLSSRNDLPFAEDWVSEDDFGEAVSG